MSAAVISFDVTRDEARTIKLIVKRAELMAMRQGQPRMNADERRDVTMDIIATHANGNPLDLSRWLAADDFNFAHDFSGIARHLDRATGKLLNHFSPRFSLPQPDRTWERKRAELSR
jgi:hypothetical protein